MFIQTLFTLKIQDGSTKNEEISVICLEETYRFMVSRSHPMEISFEIQYPEEFSIEIFKLDDRAYYPTESCYIG